MDALLHLFSNALGLGQEDIDTGQMLLRGLLVYPFAVALVRMGDKRLMGKHAALDFIVAVLLGGMLGRAVTGSAPFGPTLATCILFMAMHWLLAWCAVRWHRFSLLVKGRSRELVRDGVVCEEEMRLSKISEDDLLGSLRLNGNVDDPAKVTLATLERDGSISVVCRQSPPRVVDVRVEDGVQTVRVRLD